MKDRSSHFDRIWSGIITALLIILALIALYPVLFVISESLSSNSAAERREIFLWPVDFNLESWEKVVSDPSVLRALGTSLVSTVIGTAVCLFVTVLLAYPTSKKEFSLTKLISLGVVFTMILKPPMIPYFLTLRKYGMINNFLVLILPHTVIAYNYFVIRNFIKQVPYSLEESALIDGANPYQILFHVVLPVSKAALSTIGLFYAVLVWNQFYHPKLFLQDDTYTTIQIYLRQVLDRTSSMDISYSGLNPNAKYGPVTLNSAAVMFLTLPILCVYPFIQKNFVKGAALGAIKG